MSDVLVEYELVVPDGIVGCGVVVEEIGVAAGVLRGVAGRIRERSAAVVGVWGSLEGVYRTGDTGQLLSVMGPVGVRGDLVAWRCERVAGVLEDLAVAVVSPVGRLRELRAEAVEFLATIRGGRVVVTETVYSGTGTSFVSSGEVDWFDDPETAERNNRIIREINAEYVRLDQAQADAVNAISCVAAGSDRFGGGLGVGVYVPVGIDVLNAEGVPLPWGAATRAPTCNESVGFAIQRWGEGVVDGFAALFAGRDPVTGQHSWEVVGASWGAVGMTAAGVVLAANPATWATKGLYAAQQAVGVPLSDSQKADDDFINDALGHAGGLVAGFVDADMWGKNPTVAATTTVLNIGSVLVPGVDVLAGVKLAAGAARVGSLLERAAQFAGDAGAVSVKAALQNILKNTETLTTTIKNTNNTLTATMTEMVRKALTDLNEKLVIPRVEPTLPGTHPHNTPDHLTQVNTTTHETPPRNTTTTDNNTTTDPAHQEPPTDTNTTPHHTDTIDPSENDGNSTTNQDVPINDDLRKQIVSIEKGNRPDPETYLSGEYIGQHLSKFDDGATRFMTQSNFDKYGIGQRDGTAFVMPKSEVDELIRETGGNPREMERALGLPQGFFDGGVVRIDIPVFSEKGLRMPSGNEAGANDQWIPGGMLPGGFSEAVIDVGDLKAGEYDVSRMVNDDKNKAS